MRRSISAIEKIEIYTLVIAAIISAAISLLDLIGFLSVRWIAERIPTLTLLLVSFVLGSVIIERKRNLDAIHSLLIDIQLGQIQSLQHRIDPQLMKVFREHISSLLMSIQSAIKDKEIRLTDIEIFRYFYKRTLDVFPRATFLATSIPSQKYFWKNPYSEQAIADFIKKGGKLRRIFFLERYLPDINEEEKEVILGQLDIGVEIYVTYAKHVPVHLRAFFLVEDRGNIAWEAHIGPEREIVELVVTSNAEKTREYIRKFGELLKMNTTQKLEKSDIMTLSTHH